MDERHQDRRPTLLEILEAKLADKIDSSDARKDAFLKYKEEVGQCETTGKTAGAQSAIPLPKPFEGVKTVQPKTVPDGIPMV